MPMLIKIFSAFCVRNECAEYISMIRSYMTMIRIYMRRIVGISIMNLEKADKSFCAEIIRTKKERWRVKR